MIHTKVIVMKISKSKKELARIIMENGGWRDGCDFAVQDKDSWVCFYEGRPTRCGDAWKDKGDCQYRFGFTQDNTLTNWHQSCLSHDEYFHLYPAPDADGWIEWKGGECPVDVDALVCCKWRSGNVSITAYHAGLLSWRHNGNAADIISYRLHKPEQADPEFCESVTRAIPDPDEQVWTNPPSIEQLAADYRNAKDYAERKQQEADAAKADAEAKLKALELACEALGLLVSPITARQEPELATVQVGDEVECIKSNVNPSKYMGMRGTVLEVDDSSTPYLVDFGGVVRIWCHKVKFIRRQ